MSFRRGFKEKLNWIKRSNIKDTDKQLVQLVNSISKKNREKP